MIVMLFRLGATRLPQGSLPDPCRRTRIYNAFQYTFFVSNLVLAKSVGVGKAIGTFFCSIACCAGRILRGHVAIFTKVEITSPPFPVSRSEMKLEQLEPWMAKHLLERDSLKRTNSAWFERFKEGQYSLSNFLDAIKYQTGLTCVFPVIIACPL